jgi:hypothetical protein
MVYLLLTHLETFNILLYPHNSNPRPANAAALLRQELAAISAAGALDVDSRGSDAFFTYQTPYEVRVLFITAADASPVVIAVSWVRVKSPPV